MKLSPLLALLTWIVSVTLFAQSTVDLRDAKSPPVPDGVKATLEFDRQEYFLGENVLAHFVIQNTGTEPFTVDMGGDYRGSSRALRFKVTATDSEGRVAEDPDPNPICMGGISFGTKVAPGKKYTCSIPLIRYCQFDHPGRYTVRITHDFGWKDGPRPHPVGEAVIQFVLPYAAQAEKVVETMEKLPANDGGSAGERTKDYADFTALRQPVYLPALTRRAEAGNESALAGLGLIPTPEATEALIRLAGNASPKIALNAAMTLNRRLPDPEFKKELPGRGPFRFDQMESRERLSAKAWDDRFAPAVRALAVRFLAGTEVKEIGSGAFMLQAVGTVEEAPALKGAIERTLNKTGSPRREPGDNILNDPEPLPELLRAGQVLHARGYDLGDGFAGNAEMLLYFHWLGGKAGPRPKNWQQSFDAYRTVSFYPIREAVLQSIPEPLPESCFPGVLAALNDRDLGVVRTACTIAGKSGDARFVKPLLEIIATESHEWALREASNSAMALKAGYDLLKTWSTRLGEERMLEVGLDALQTIIEPRPNGSSGRTDLSREERLAIRAAWQRFLTEHEKELRAGRQYRLGGPELTPDLFGRARQFQLPGGGEWPPSKEAR